tara:strand:+ start:778 stop:1188 length:411 start_codon:yes stop_codon:yes gene_type:complete
VTEDLYREILEFHAEHPQGSQQLEDYDNVGNYQSLKTGNNCSVRMKTKNGVIEQISVEVNGSALARACGSIMACSLKDVKLAEARKTAFEILSFLDGKKTLDLPGDLSVYRSIIDYPERFDCALLAWRSLLEAVGS